MQPMLMQFNSVKAACQKLWEMAQSIPATNALKRQMDVSIVSRPTQYTEYTDINVYRTHKAILLFVAQLAVV